MDWAIARYGVSRFLVAIPVEEDRGDLVPVEIASPRGSDPDEWIVDLASLLERGRR